MDVQDSGLYSEVSAVRRTSGGVPWLYAATIEETRYLFGWARERNVLAPEELSAAFGLTPTQARVARMLHGRRTTREMAGLLGNSVNTLNHHIEMVLLKLNVPNRWAVEARLDAASIHLASQNVAEPSGPHSRR